MPGNGPPVTFTSPGSIDVNASSADWTAAAVALNGRPGVVSACAAPGGSHVSVNVPPVGVSFAVSAYGLVMSHSAMTLVSPVLVRKAWWKMSMPESTIPTTTPAPVRPGAEVRK